MENISNKQAGKREKGSIRKRALWGLLFLMMLCSLSACEKSSKTGLKERGLFVAELLWEKGNSDFYLEAVLSSSHQDNPYLKSFRKMDYDKPQAYYVIKLDDKFIEELFDLEGLDGDGFYEMSEENQSSFRSQIMSSLITSMNSRTMGYEAVVAGSALSSGCTFADKSLANVREILLLIYEDAYPIAVTLHGSKDGAVSASGTVLFIEDFEADSADDVKEAFCKSLYGDGGDLLEDYLTVEKLK